jgi:hypothetical protein
MEKVLKTKYGDFTVLIDDKYACLLDGKCYVAKQRTASRFIHYVVSVSKNGFYRRNTDMRFLHLVIAEEALERPLESNEVVHHINGNCFDSRVENLLVLTQAEHARLHMKMSLLYAQRFQESFASDDQLNSLLDRNTRRTREGLRVMI